MILHKDYGHTPEGHRRYSRDERYKRLMQEFAQARLRCSDYGLDKKLHNLIEQQKLEAKYLLGASMGKFQGSLESTEQDIRNYINTKFGGREVLPAE